MPLENLPRLTIQLYAEQSDDTSFLLRHLQRSRAAVRHIWPMTDRIGEAADIVIADYTPGLGARLNWVPGEATAALVIVLPQAGRFDLREVQAACPDAVLHRPLQEGAINIALAVALDHFNLGKRLRQRITRMDENIRAMRDIEKAKYLIMARDKVGEADAFRQLREMAMKRRTTIASFAAKFIDSVENLI